MTMMATLAQPENLSSMLNPILETTNDICTYTLDPSVSKWKVSLAVFLNHDIWGCLENPEIHVQYLGTDCCNPKFPQTARGKVPNERKSSKISSSEHLGTFRNPACHII